MPPSLEGKPHIPSGVTEACLMNDHSVCTNPRCSCSCHRPEVNPNIPPTSIETGPEKACPKCGSHRPFGETFCRFDGERLASLLCGMCGKGMNVEDLYCYNCGAPKGATSPTVVKVPQIVVPLQQDDEVDYAKQVLAGVQRELTEGGNGNVQQPNEVDGDQRVVEQIGGAQGSFKLVSAPNPNKVRVPTPSGPPKGPKVRLPIKPA